MKRFLRASRPAEDAGRKIREKRKFVSDYRQTSKGEYFSVYFQVFAVNLAKKKKKKE